MYYEPKPQNKKPQILTGVSAAAGIAVFLLAPILPMGRAPLQAVAILLFAVGLFYSLRYVMTSFSYALEPSDGASGEDFVVRKSQGRRIEIIEARLTLDELVCFTPLVRGKIGKDMREKYPTMRVYNYTVTYRPDGAYLAVFVDSADNVIGVILEPSTEMVTLFSEKK